ncbi:N-acetyltransferase [Kibdelosporangium aridum]|uniref:N-acetyltransferase n=1 Tax=Kibdelosporangium aridum TaxID=2030 RepID=A0A428Z7J7_KIBAR|nr:GNAT family protein [Kibdelosporangium aridum]RSM83572.1 N-acetyltransferase [Kibdelosporangium aridum]
MELVTADPRVRVRTLDITDLDDYWQLLERNRDHLGQHGDYAELRAADYEMIRAGFEQPIPGEYAFGIRVDGGLVGEIVLHPVNPPHYSLGYWIDGEATGNSHVTTAGRALLDWARTNTGITEVYAGVTVGNRPSIAVLDRLGFVKVSDMDTYTRYRLRLREASSACASGRTP